MALCKENSLPQFKVASNKCLGIRLSFKDPTILLPGGGGRTGRQQSLEKIPPKYAIFSTALSKIVVHCSSTKHERARFSSCYIGGAAMLK